MIPLSESPRPTCLHRLSLFYTTDALLDELPVLIFYGPSTVGNSTNNSSRIQAHVYSLAGFQSFPRLTVAPTSPLYAAVNHLPSEQQGDEISRGLAVSLLSYFAEVPTAVKNALRGRAAARRVDGPAPMMFDEMHAGDLASDLTEIEDSRDIANYLSAALAAQVLSWTDMHMVLPPGTVQRAISYDETEALPLFDDCGLPLYRYGQYSSLVDNLGMPTFLPTSKIQRAPSRPTVHSKSKVIVKDQKISLRRDLCELVDTERSFIDKMDDLVNSLAVNFKRKSQSASVLALFPESAASILEVNSSFYNDIQAILDETENEAIQDIEGSANSDTDSIHPFLRSGRRDPTGTTQIAKALLQWFPKFVSPYRDYLRASIDFSAAIGQIVGDNFSNASRHLQDIGEQHLRSTLIEPVQRLPRYSLLIDNMVNVLPRAHPALTSLLKAKDIITDICALDIPTAGDNTRVARVLRDLVKEWPTLFLPTGRLIAAVDIAELEPPYVLRDRTANEVLLLFAANVVILRKLGENALSARGVIAEVDRPSASFNTNRTPETSTNSGLTFVKTFSLVDLNLSESEDSTSMRLTFSTKSVSAYARSHEGSCVTKTIALLGSYEGKAPKLSEEIIKAKMEGLFVEGVRESDRWALRTIAPAAGGMGIVVALSDDGMRDMANPGKESCRIRVYLDGSISTKSYLEQHPCSTIAACITSSAAGGYHMEIEGVGGTRFTDDCSEDSVVAVLVARVATINQLEDQPQAWSSGIAHISLHQKILEALPLAQHQGERRTRSLRPLSPVKMISNLLGSVSLSHTNTPLKSRHNTSVLKDMPSLPPPVPSKANTDSSKKMCESPTGNDTTASGPDGENFMNPLAHLEEGFNAYIVALRSRSGNVVGRVLRGRGSVDELTINELYNAILEDPSRIQAAAEVSVDVLFAAFENFLQRAWRERMGFLLPPDILLSMQSVFDSGKPTMLAQQVQRSIDEMPPQNRRAFAATINLLSDLLDASGNDGDRGALMASFAEVLFPVTNPHDYIMLLDHLVDDYETLFAETLSTMKENSIKSSTNSVARTRSFNTGSISSNTSSLRKKFGFGTLTRENSKSEPESKVASIWRTLSKTSKDTTDSHSQPSSISKASGPSLIRSRSTDTDPRMLPPGKSIPRDRPTSSGSTPQEEPRSRPGSSHVNVSLLRSIGENTPTRPSTLTKKKRRSSLSDLKSLQQPDLSTAWATPQSQGSINNRKGDVRPFQRRASPRRWQVSNQEGESGLPQSEDAAQRSGSPQRLEHRPLNVSTQKLSTVPCSKTPMSRQKEEVVISKFSPQKQQTSRSGLPAPRGGLTERTWPPNSNNMPPIESVPSLRKLRMQSPQKIRERLSQEQNALSISDESFQAELTKIGDEMAKCTIQLSPTKARSTMESNLSINRKHATMSTLNSLSSRLTTLQAKVSESTEKQRITYSNITSDLESSLVVSDKKARKLDELYWEANAENEALYERFNDELGKILGKVKKGEGVEEMKSKLRDSQEEVMKLKKENSKLKREAIGLRSMLRDEP